MEQLSLLQIILNPERHILAFSLFFTVCELLFQFTDKGFLHFVILFNFQGPKLFAPPCELPAQRGVIHILSQVFLKVNTFFKLFLKFFRNVFEAVQSGESRAFKALSKLCSLRETYDCDTPSSLAVSNCVLPLALR